MASDVLLAAEGHWPRLLAELAGLTPEQLQDRHQPCPACGGTDRYRWDRDDGPGGWYCNQCGGRERSGGGGSGLDLLLRVTGWDFATAARHLEAHLRLEQPKPLRVALPPPVAAQRAEPDVSWDGLLASAASSPPPLPKAVSAFHLALLDEHSAPLPTGSPYAYSDHQRVSRVDRSGGKVFYANHRTDQGWQRGAGPAPWPMYQWPSLLQARGHWLLELEGEKCADLLISGGFLASTQPGHAHSSPQIAERYRALRQAGVAGIVYLSDHDEQGQRRARQVIKAAAEVGLPLLHLPAGEIWSGLPPGGSVDDAPGLLGERISVILRAARAAHLRLHETPVALAPAPDALPAATAAVTDRPFLCLGYDSDGYYYQPRSTGQVMRLSSSAHGGMNLCRLAPLAYWETLYPSSRGVNWTAAASDLFCRQAAIGMFNPDQLRGRGIWWDDRRCVLHLGDRLVVDGSSQPLNTPFPSRFHYQRGTALVGTGDAVPLTDEEAFLVLSIADRFHWEVPASGLLLAGWITLAPICGALSWRPHLWLSGPAGSGKSHVFERFCGVLLADLARVFVGSVTEAGIRQTLHSDALPVLIDEAEGNEREDQQRIQAILALARVASSESRAAIVKGSPSGDVARYSVRSMFLLASIATGLKQGADRRRFALLNLRNPSEIPQQEREVHWQALDRDLQQLITPVFASRLLARTVALIPVIRRSIAVCSRVSAAHFDSQALGDQYGTLLAGAWSLQSSRVPTEAEVQDLIQGTDWSSYRESTEIADERRCLNRILQHQLRVESEERSVLSRTVLELVELVSSALPSPMELVRPADAGDLLARHGLRVREGELLISNSAEAIARMLADTAWVTNWGAILSRLPGASRSQLVHFRGLGSSRAVALPLAMLTGAGALDGPVL